MYKNYDYEFKFLVNIFALLTTDSNRLFNGFITFKLK